MKRNKIIAVIAVVVVLSMSLAAFALASTQPAVSGPATAEAGAPVTFTIATNNEGLSGNVSASDNLVFQSAGREGIGPTNPGDFAVVGGTITYNYIVAAGTPAGATFRFEVNGMQAYDEDGNAVALANTTIFAEGTVTGVVITTPPVDVTTPPVTTTAPPGGTPDTPRPPKVGDDTSATPIVIGGIAVLVLALGIFGYVKLK